MRCPKCDAGTLSAHNHFRWQCDHECGFACGLNFFFDDENLASKLEVGFPVHQLILSARAKELVHTKALSLDELHVDKAVGKLRGMKEIEAEEQLLSELSALMQQVMGRSAEVHRHLSSGESYHKYRSGGLIGRKVGAMTGGKNDIKAYDENK